MFRSIRFHLLIVSATLVLLWSISDSHAQDLSGRWQGSWRSCKTSHRGKLSATFCQLDQQHVQATFRGTFAKVIPFRYRAVLDVVSRQPGMMQLSGSKKLGPIMGTFSYNATIVNDQFSAEYSSRRDSGVWNLQR